MKCIKHLPQLGYTSQISVYNEALRRCKRRGVVWLAALDADEYLTPTSVYPYSTSTSTHRLPLALSHLEANDSVAAVAVNWRWIPTGGTIWRPRTATPTASLRVVTPMEEANFRTGIDNEVIKSVLKVNRTLRYRHMHYATYVDPSAAIRVTSQQAAIGPIVSPPEVLTFSVLHFRTRSFEDFLLKIQPAVAECELRGQLLSQLQGQPQCTSE